MMSSLRGGPCLASPVQAAPIPGFGYYQKKSRQRLMYERWQLFGLQAEKAYLARGGMRNFWPG